MARNRKSTITQVSEAVKEAAQTVMEKTGEYVVQPVGRALGLSNKPRSKKTRGTSRRKTNPARRTTRTGKIAGSRRTKARASR